MRKSVVREFGAVNSTPDEKDLIPAHIREAASTEIFGYPGEVKHTADYTLVYPEGDFEIPVGGKRKLILVKGAQKSRKSLFTSCLLSSAFIDERRYTLGFNLKLKPEETILHFDTEMEEDETWDHRDLFNKLCGLPPKQSPQYRTFNIKYFSSAQRAEIITHFIKTSERPIGVVCIDQIADLAFGYNENDRDTIANIMELIDLWKRLSDALVIVTMHTNRGGVQTNGMLGKMLDQKCFGSFLITKDKDTGISTAEHFDARKRPVKNIKFMHDINSKPRFMDYDDIDF